MYKVYHMSPASHYYGFALVAANSAEDANEHIAERKAEDPDNRWDSFGYCYVAECDQIEYLTSSIEGFVFDTIRYSGW